MRLMPRVIPARMRIVALKHWSSIAQDVVYAVHGGRKRLACWASKYTTSGNKIETSSRSFPQSWAEYQLLIGFAVGYVISRDHSAVS